ncbi:MAG: T9SS type A sorting domain-containing protein, partial [Nitrososphaera sp.]|nr:T9SS type A sorting domain-containing protein [Nitrososphaera sp.]
WQEVPVTTVWQEFTYTLTPNTTDANADFSIQCGDMAGTVWIDDLDVRKTVAKITVPFENLELPGAFALHQNYPNPFNPETLIRFALPKQQAVWLAVYNILGQKVRTLIDGAVMERDFYTVAWNGRDDNEVALPSGVYLYKLQTSEFQQTRKMLMVK